MHNNKKHTKKTVLITGGSGLLAVNWASLMRHKFNIVLCLHEFLIEVDGVKEIVCSLDSISSIVKCLKQEDPHIVIHAAAITNVEKCEVNPKLAEYVNVTISKNIAIACDEQHIRLVHISTDHLFNGNDSLYSEKNPFSPVNIYGLTKSRSETLSLKYNDKSLIISTNFFGWGLYHRHSFSDFIFNALMNRHKLELFDNVFYTPIFVDVLVETVHELIENNATGVFNVVCDERISKYKFGIKLARVFKLRDDLIIPSDFLNSNLVKRPLDMSLSNKKVCNVIGKNLGDVDKHLYMLSRKRHK